MILNNWEILSNYNQCGFDVAQRVNDGFPTFSYSTEQFTTDDCRFVVLAFCLGIGLAGLGGFGCALPYLWIYEFMQDFWK